MINEGIKEEIGRRPLFAGWKNCQREALVQHIEGYKSDLPRELEKKVGGMYCDEIMELKPYIVQRCKEIDNTRVEIIMEALSDHRQRFLAAGTVHVVLTGGGSQSRTLHAALDEALRAKKWSLNVTLSPVRQMGSSGHHGTDDIVRGLYRIACEPKLGYAVRANKHYVLAHDAPEAPVELGEGEDGVIYYYNLAMQGCDMADASVSTLDLEPTNIEEPEIMLRIGTVTKGEKPHLDRSSRGEPYYLTDQVRAMRSIKYALPPLHANRKGKYVTYLRLERVDGMKWEFAVFGRLDGAEDNALRKSGVSDNRETSFYNVKCEVFVMPGDCLEDTPLEGIGNGGLRKYAGIPEPQPELEDLGAPEEAVMDTQEDAAVERSDDAVASTARCNAPDGIREVAGVPDPEPDSEDVRTLGSAAMGTPEEAAVEMNEDVDMDPSDNATARTACCGTTT
ncbi:hypothetical protein LTS12_027699, partial [Elasticomyces elasticus]